MNAWTKQHWMKGFRNKRQKRSNKWLLTDYIISHHDGHDEVFNTRSSHGHHSSRRREHAHSHGSRAFTHILTPTQLQPRGAKRQLSYYFSVHAGSFYCFRNLPNSDMEYRICIVCTWSFLCVCIPVYTRGLGTPTASQHNIFDSEKILFGGLWKHEKTHHAL